MKSIAQSLKGSLKSTLQHLGLYKYALQIRWFLNPKRRRYRKIKRFTASLNGVIAQFSTEDEYSNSWFFPRYAGGRIHEKKVTEMLMEALHRAKCFVDVGTNLGWYTCLAAKHMPYGSVYGFEMDDLNFALLKKNIAINKCSNVEVHHLAVSDSTSVVSYKREANRPSPMFHLQTRAKDENSIGFVSVNSIALDDFFKSKRVMPDVIKIDVEGAEVSVLMGMKRILRDCKPILFLEIHPSKLRYFNTSTSAIISLFIENNYGVFEIQSMRNPGSKKQLKPLLRDSLIEDNTMLYATPAGEEGCKAT
jgi:FkbM family methyltransferase